MTHQKRILTQLYGHMRYGQNDSPTGGKASNHDFVLTYKCTFNIYNMALIVGLFFQFLFVLF